MKSLGHIVDDLLERILPGRCASCDIPSADPVCANCVPTLPWHAGRRNGCQHCDEWLPHGGNTCAACQRHAPAFDATVCPFYWDEPVDDWISSLKYRAALHHARGLATLCAPVFQHETPHQPDILVPVPLHDQKIRERGFNQALELGRTLSKLTGIPLRTDVVRRTEPTPPQRGADRATRRRNVRGVFACEHVPSGAHVAILDDVLTTGATADSLARALRKAGAARVTVWAVARATRGI